MPTRVLVSVDSTTGTATILNADEPILYADDLAAVRGDGVFETILVRDRRAVWLHDHLTRLAESARMLDLTAPDASAWRRAVDIAIGQWGSADGVLRLVVSRGRESGGGPTALVSIGPVFDRVESVRRDGVDVVTLDRGFDTDLARRAPWQLLGAKTLSYATNMAALRHAESLGAGDVIFVSTDGFVLEGPRSSVVAVTGRTLRTPPPESGVLRSITVDALFALASEQGYRCEHAVLTVADLVAAQTVWLVSSITLAARVRRLDGAERPRRAGDDEFMALLDHAVESDRKNTVAESAESA